MSLTALLDDPTTRRAIAPFIVRAPLPAALPCRVPPATTHPAIIGTAIEYAIFAGVRARRDVRGEPRAARVGLACVRAWSPGLRRNHGLDALGRRVEEAEAALLAQGTGPLAAEVARACIVLARAAMVARAEVWFLSHLPTRAQHILAEPTPPEVGELAALYDLLPLDALAAHRRIVVAPTFGEGSRILGGAEADLLVDDTLLEVKTREWCRIGLTDVRQLVAYAGLAHRFTGLGPIHHIGALFPRAGGFRTVPLRQVVTEGGEDAVVDALLHRARAAGEASWS